jgi:hypothetical protein
VQALVDFYEKNFFFSTYRVRIFTFGFGWRAAAYSRAFHGKKLRYQREPVRVLRAFSWWVQWGRYEKAAR